MRWLGFALCAVMVLTLQTTLAWRVEIRGARPDWMLALAVFFALHGRSPDVLIGAWLLGAAADVMSIERFGLLALCYGLSAAAIYALRDLVFRDNPLTHFALTLAPAVAIGGVTRFYQAIVLGGSMPGWAEVAGGIPLRAVYVALWAPLLHYVLLKFPHLLGLAPPRRSYRAPQKS